MISLRKNDVNNLKEITSIKQVYKLNNGMIIDQYRDFYGYWYYIRRGDSIFKIAQNTGCSYHNLIRINDLNKNSPLKYGAFLFIPLSEDYLKKTAEIINVNIQKGDFIWPVYGRISSGFGLRHWGWRNKFHKGIDIVAPMGTKIMCTADGIVKSAQRVRDYGYVVTIEHTNNFQSIYAHLKKILVTPNEKVKQGQIIGLVGKTGDATGYHLHFELRINDYPVNPTDYLPVEADELAKLYYVEKTGKLH